MRCFQNGVIGQIEQTKDDYQHYGNHNHQAPPGALLVFVLTAPVHVVACGQLHLVRELGPGLVNKATYIATAHIQQYCSPQKPVLARDHSWPLDGANLGQLRQRNGCACGRRNWDIAQSCRTAAILLRVANANRKTPAPFDSDCEIRFTDARCYSVLNSPDIDPITSGGRSVDMNVDVRSAADLLRIDIDSAWYRLHDFGHPTR